MPEVAGSVVVTIGGDISAFEAALAKAKQQAVAFDAQISAQLNGAGVSAGLEKIAAGVEQTNALLTKLTTTGISAGATMTKIAAASTATTAALTEVATASKLATAELGSIGVSGGAGLATGTIAAKDFAAALELTGGNLSKITPQMVGLAAANEEVAVSSKAAAVGMAGLGAAETEAAGLGAGVTREFSVLGAEVARGNFSRIPGSLIVMNERLAATGAGVLTLTNFTKAFGALGSVIFNPYVLGFLALSIGTEVALRGFGALKGGVDEATSALEAHKKTIDAITAAYPEAAAAAKKFTDQAKDIPKAVAASNLSNDIVTSVTAMDTALKEIEKTLASPILSGGRSNFDGIGLTAAREFAQLGQELKAGTITAVEYQIALAKISLDPNVTIKAREYARALQEGAAKLIELENAAKQSSVVKDIAVDGAKAQQTLFDVSAGFKDINTSAVGADATIAKLFGTVNSGGGSGFGVTKSITGQLGGQLNGQLQATLGLFEQVDAAVQNTRQNQLAGMVQLEAQFRATTTKVDELKQAIDSAGSADDIRQFFGDVSNIKDASAEIGNAASASRGLFAAMASGNKSVTAVNQGLQAIRQTLINDGFPPDKVDAFLNRLIEANRQLVADQGQVHQLGAAINALHDRTITITVATRQVGTGLQSSYQVPTTYGGAESAGTGSSYGVAGTSNVNVTRYGAPANSGTGFTQQDYSVPSESGGGTAGVTVTRFGGTRAAGGPVRANTPYWVGEHGPELVVPSSAGSVVPNGQSTALANPQSGFTGTQPTTEDNRYWTVLMNIEAATQKTAQLLDDIKTMGAVSNSGSGGSSYGSSSGSQAYDSNGLNAAGHTAQQIAVYNEVLKSYMANYAAIGGGGIIGYGSSGLAATPQQIAANIAYGGASPLGGVSGGGSTGSNGYQYLHAGDPVNASLTGLVPGTAQYAQAYAQALAKSNAAKGFATGGIDSSDTQKVEFFKNPNEKVIIATPQQFADVRPGSSGGGGTNDNRPITQTFHVSIQAKDGTVNKESLAALRTQFAAIGRDMARSINGR